MGDARANPPRMSTLRIVGGLTLSLGFLWFALPFWLHYWFLGPGMTKFDEPPTTVLFFSPWPLVGLIIILFGLGFLDLARGRWLLPAIVALVVLIIALSCVPR